MKIIILAAGKGVRMSPLTDSNPKALVELKGKPLLERCLTEFAKAGALQIVLVVGYLHEQIKNFFGKKFGKIPITYILQKQQLGTAHAISLAEPFAKKQGFFVGQADVIIPFAQIKNFFVFCKKNSAKFDAIVAVRFVPDVSKFGLIEEQGNIVTALKEKTGEKKPGLINAGLWWFSPKIFAAIKKTKKSLRGEFEITDSAKKFLKKKRLGCFEIKGKIFDIGTTKELEQAEKQISVLN